MRNFGPMPCENWTALPWIHGDHTEISGRQWIRRIELEPAGKIDAARRIVTRFLRGELNPEDNPEFFDDDILRFAVARLDIRDTAWLLAQVASIEWPRELRAEIASMILTHYEDGQALLDRDEW